MTTTLRRARRSILQVAAMFSVVLTAGMSIYSQQEAGLSVAELATLEQLVQRSDAPAIAELEKLTLQPSLPIALATADAMRRWPSARHEQLLRQMAQRHPLRERYALRCATVLALAAMPEQTVPAHRSVAERDYDSGQLRLLLGRQSSVEGLEPLPTFYGLPVAARRLVLVIDKSASMQLPAQRGARSRWQRTLTEIQQLLATLPPATQLAIVPFDRRPWAWQADWVSMSDAARWDAQRYLADITCGHDTDLYAALATALTHYAECEAMYVVTDGELNHGSVRSRERLLQQVGQLNQLRRVSIYTLGVAPRRQSQQLLQALAEQNLGAYHRVE